MAENQPDVDFAHPRSASHSIEINFDGVEEDRWSTCCFCVFRYDREVLF